MLCYRGFDMDIVFNSKTRT